VKQERQGRLWICGTPIGNLEDVSLRLLKVLRSVDVIAAEDTRRTGKLLNHYRIHNKLISYHEHNERTMLPRLMNMLKEGLQVALVSDAGMPGISDPGSKLVAAAAANDLPVALVPGPTAVVGALVLSGLDIDRFVFYGFVPRRLGEREELKEELENQKMTAVLYEAPHRVRETLSWLGGFLGDRLVVLVRELTKIHEEVLRGTAEQVLAAVGEEPRGECTLVLEGAPKRKTPANLAKAVEMAQELRQWGLGSKDAARVASKFMGVPARAIYQALIES
jgi:16S rRNA (cytidine1402-2'-O)-methyltransferase